MERVVVGTTGKAASGMKRVRMLGMSWNDEYVSDMQGGMYVGWCEQDVAYVWRVELQVWRVAMPVHLAC